MPRTPTVIASIVPVLLEHARARGVDPLPLCLASGVDVAGLGVPDARLELTTFYALIEAIAQALDDPRFGLRLMETWQPEVVEVFDVMGYLLYTAPTLREGLRRFCDVRALWSDGESLWIEARAEGVCVAWRPFGPHRPAHEQLGDIVLCDLVRGAAALIGAPVVPVTARLMLPAPEDAATRAHYLGDGTPGSAWLGERVVFGAPWLEVVLTREVVDRPLHSADAVLHAYFSRQVDARLRTLDAGERVSARLRRALEPRLPASAPGEVSIERLAPALNMSARTLQRALREEGTTYSKELDALRHELALRYLGAHVSLGEVAYLLGFSEPSAFHRAFRRWTGDSPANVRAQLARTEHAHKPL